MTNESRSCAAPPQFVSITREFVGISAWYLFKYSWQLVLAVFIVLDSVSSCLIEVDVLSYLRGIVTDETKPVELLRNCLTLMKSMSATGMLILLTLRVLRFWCWLQVQFVLWSVAEHARQGCFCICCLHVLHASSVWLVLIADTNSLIKFVLLNASGSRGNDQIWNYWFKCWPSYRIWAKLWIACCCFSRRPASFTKKFAWFNLSVCVTRIKCLLI
jgi:hypothetical protein